MGGTYTDERALRVIDSFTRSQQGPGGTIDVDSKDIGSGGYPYLATRQVTTSYRTGRRDESVTQEAATETDLLSGHPNSLKKFRQLKDEQRKFGFAPGNTGHPFFTVRKDVECDIVDIRGFSPSAGPAWWVEYKGPIHCWVGSGYSNWDYTWRIPGTINTSFYGPLGIYLSNPARPVAGLATAVGEFRREGLPNGFGDLWNLRDRGRKFKKLGDAYLEKEFGWDPLINDLRSVVTALMNSSKRISQFAAGSGAVTRREFTFDPVISNQWAFGSGFIAHTSNTSAVDWCIKDRVYTGTRRESTSSREVYRFVGGFTYHLNSGRTFLGKLERYEQMANHLLGIRITPEVLWDLAPWTWLSDWFANIGTNIANISAFMSDDLTMPFAWLMRETFTEHAIIVSGPRLKAVDQPTHWRTVWNLHQKERVGASPFGFALTPGDFSDRQWAILGALGISKGPKAL